MVPPFCRWLWRCDRGRGEACGATPGLPPPLLHRLVRVVHGGDYLPGSIPLAPIHVQILTLHPDRPGARWLIHRDAADVEGEVAVRGALDLLKLDVTPTGIDRSLGHSPHPLRA